MPPPVSHGRRPVHGVAAQPPGGYTGVVAHERPTPFEPLPDWWALIANGTGDGGLNTINFGDLRFPISGASAPDQLLPVPFGQVRVGGTVIASYIIPPFSEVNSLGLTIAWSEGEIESIDSFLCQGVSIAAFSESWRELTFTHYRGLTTDPSGGAHSPTVAGSCSFTKLETWRTVNGPIFLNLPPDSGDGTWEWAADVHGLKLYDPRLDTTKGGSGSQRSNDPTTWTYSNNPVLIARYLWAKYGNLPDSRIDDASIRAAAAASDTAGFSCNIVFTTKTLLSDAIAAVLQTCNGIAVPSSGRMGIFVDVVNAGAAAATLLEEDGDVWGLRYEWLSARDRYTSIAVAFKDSAANYKDDATPFVEDPGVALLTVPLKPLIVSAPGINTLAAAVVLRDYLFNSQAVRFRISGTMRGQGILLSQGQKIHITTLKGIDLDCVIVQISGDAQGFFSFVAKPYLAAVFATTPLGQGPPIFPPTIDSSEPPPPSAIRLASSPYVGLVFDAPRVYTAAGPFGSGWTVTRATGVDTTKINDGNTTVVAFTTDPDVALGYIETVIDLDLGAGNDLAFGRCRLWLDVPIADLAIPVQPIQIRGADEPTFAIPVVPPSLATQSVDYPWNDAAVGGVYPTCIEMPSAPDPKGTWPHRYWRVTLRTYLPVNVYEIQFDTYVDFAGTITGYDLHLWPGVEVYPPVVPAPLIPYLLPDPANFSVERIHLQPDVFFGAVLERRPTLPTSSDPWPALGLITTHPFLGTTRLRGAVGSVGPRRRSPLGVGLSFFTVYGDPAAGDPPTAANLVLAGPTSGAAGDVAFRVLVSADIPNNAADTTGKAAKADALSTTGASVNVSAAAPPVTGRVLTATDATHATWQAPSGGGGTVDGITTVTLVAGTGISITDNSPIAGDITIAATGAIADDYALPFLLMGG